MTETCDGVSHRGSLPQWSEVHAEISPLSEGFSSGTAARPRCAPPPVPAPMAWLQATLLEEAEEQLSWWPKRTLHYS